MKVQRRFSFAFLSLLFFACGEGTPAGVHPEEWVLVADEDLAGAYLGGTSDRNGDLWVVGGNPDKGVIQQYDGDLWRDMSPPGAKLLWWVHSFDDGAVVAVGRGGGVWVYNDSEWNPLPGPSENEDFYGVWGVSVDDFWIAGGPSLGSLESGAVLRHWDGESWTDGLESIELADDVRNYGSIYKVWGSDSDEVVAVGSHGMAYHFDGKSWSALETPALGSTLFTVVGRSSSDIYAVGSIPIPVLLHWDGTVWESVPLPLDTPPILQGLWAAEGGALYISGLGGYVARRDNEGTWKPGEMETAHSFHAIFGVSGGHLIAVGGNIASVKESYLGTIATTDSTIREF